jgi:beta-glucosidase
MRAPRRFRPDVLELLEERCVLTVFPIGPIPGESAVVPTARYDMYSLVRHGQDLGQALQGGTNVVFLGDSITDYFRTNGAAVWQSSMAPLGAADFAIQGNTTENVLWQVATGELLSQPKVVVLQIGTNNLGMLGDSAAATAQGIAVDVAVIHAVSPRSQILLLGVFPRGLGVSDPLTQEAYQVNAMIAGLDNGADVHFLNIDAGFLNPNGSLNLSLLGDGVHPTALGYAYWANSIIGELNALTGYTPAGTPAPSKPSSPLLGLGTPPTTSSTLDPSKNFLLIALPPSADPSIPLGLPDLAAASNPKAHKNHQAAR